MAYDQEILELKASNWVRLDYQNAPLVSQRTLTRGIPVGAKGYNAKVLAFLDLFIDATNTGPTSNFSAQASYVDDPQADQVAYSKTAVGTPPAGRWRLVSNGYNAQLKMYVQVLRYGWATSVLSTSLPNDECLIASGADTRPLPRTFGILWRNISKSSVFSCIQELRVAAYFTNPVIQGETKTGKYYIGDIASGISDDGSYEINAKLTKVAQSTPESEAKLKEEARVNLTGKRRLTRYWPCIDPSLVDDLLVTNNNTAITGTSVTGPKIDGVSQAGTWAIIQTGKTYSDSDGISIFQDIEINFDNSIAMPSTVLEQGNASRHPHSSSRTQVIDDSLTPPDPLQAGQYGDVSYSRNPQNGLYNGRKTLVDYDYLIPGWVIGLVKECGLLVTRIIQGKDGRWYSCETDITIRIEAHTSLSSAHGAIDGGDDFEGYKSEVNHLSNGQYLSTKVTKGETIFTLLGSQPSGDSEG